MSKICGTKKYYSYPSIGLILPYIYTLYDWTRGFKNQMPHLLRLSGNVRCRGYYGFLKGTQTIEVSQLSVALSNWEISTLKCFRST